MGSEQVLVGALLAGQAVMLVAKFKVMTMDELD